MIFPVIASFLLTCIALAFFGRDRWVFQLPSWVPCPQLLISAAYVGAGTEVANRCGRHELV